MDDLRFDRLTRSIATSRRRVVVAMLGLAAFSADRGVASAGQTRCRRERQTCARNSQCCTGTCNSGRDVPLKHRNRCVCIPNCGGGRCGDDGCGGQCPACENDEHYCTDAGTCERACDFDDEWCFLSTTDDEFRNPSDCATRVEMSGACSTNADCLAHADYQGHLDAHPSNIEAVCVHIVFFRGGFNQRYQGGSCFVKPPVTGTCW